MKKTLLFIGLTLGMLVSPLAIVGGSNYAFANAKSEIQSGISDAGGKDNNKNLTTVITDIVKTMLFIVGLLSVVIIIYSGILYIISAGNSSTVQKAKTTLTYAVVGLIVAILSYAIVSFVVNALKK